MSTGFSTLNWLLGCLSERWERGELLNVTIGFSPTKCALVIILEYRPKLGCRAESRFHHAAARLLNSLSARANSLHIAIVAPLSTEKTPCPDVCVE